MKEKPVFLNEARIGSARSWHDVAQLVGTLLDRQIGVKEIVQYGSEGPDGFHIRMQT